MTQSSLAELPDLPNARLLGDLARGGVTWRVFLEIKTDAQPARGRVHFISESAQRSTGWIFVEWSEPDLLRRFHDFSAVELWRLVESIA